MHVWIELVFFAVCFLLVCFDLYRCWSSVGRRLLSLVVGCRCRDVLSEAYHQRGIRLVISI